MPEIRKSDIKVVLVLASITLMGFAGAAFASDTGTASIQPSGDAEVFSENTVVDDVTVTPEQNQTHITVVFDETPRDEVQECDFSPALGLTQCYDEERPVDIPSATIEMTHLNANGTTTTTPTTITDDNLTFTVPHSAKNVSVTMETSTLSGNGESTLYLELVHDENGNLTRAYRALVYE